MALSGVGATPEPQEPSSKAVQKAQKKDPSIFNSLTNDELYKDTVQDGVIQANDFVGKAKVLIDLLKGFFGQKWTNKNVLLMKATVLAAKKPPEKLDNQPENLQEFPTQETMRKTTYQHGAFRIDGYKFDQNGNTLLEERVDNGKVISYIGYEYDDQNRMTKKTWYGPQGDVREVTTYSYINDDTEHPSQAWYDSDGDLTGYQNEEIDTYGNGGFNWVRVRNGEITNVGYAKDGKSYLDASEGHVYWVNHGYEKGDKPAMFLKDSQSGEYLDD
jgi:hypothetical protein